MSSDEDTGRIVRNVSIAVVLLFASLLMAFAGMIIENGKVHRDLGVMSGEIGAFSLVYHDIQYGIEDVLERLGIIEANTESIRSACAYKPTAMTQGYFPKNCQPLTTRMGYGLVDCPLQGITTYYCDGKIVDKKKADCCDPNVNTGECN